MPAIDIDISVENDGWPAFDTLNALCAKAIETAADFLHVDAGQPFPDAASELSIVFTDDAAIRDLNTQWRGKASATNVLSFPAFPLEPGGMPGPMLGDLVLARETIAAEAVQSDITVEAHVTHLLVHGFLHLLGYDHVGDEEADEMEGLETRILATLGLSDPYAEYDSA